MNETDFQKRIGYEKDIKPLLEQVSHDYNIGSYISHKIIPLGYEDFNLVLETSKGKYFAKFFANFRNDDECRRYVDILSAVITAGVSCPKVLKSHQDYLYVKNYDGHTFRLCLMDYIDGFNFLDGNLSPNENEKRFLIEQATIINSIDLKPDFIYDSWATVNFLKEYEKSKKYLDMEALEKIEPLTKEFESLNIEELPHCFVHGDIIKTNVMKDKSGNIYIIDFAVSNYYPRIVELAVLLCNMFFDENDPASADKNYQFAIDEYQKKIKLTDFELKTLLLFAKIAHAMHVTRGTYEREVNNNHTEENDYWINLGKAGLEIKK